jgi:hypothetical protein
VPIAGDLALVNLMIGLFSQQCYSTVVIDSTHFCNKSAAHGGQNKTKQKKH